MNILLLLLFGAVVGWVTSMIVGTNTGQGLLGDIMLGVVGSLLGGFVFGLFGEPGVTGFNLYSFVVGTIGAVVFVLAGRSLSRLFT